MRMTKLTPLFLAGALAFAANPAHSSEGTFSIPTLIPELAVEAVEAAMEACRDKDTQVAVAVVDRFGVTQAVKRDRFAGAHTVDTAVSKAWTAVSFRTDTLELRDSTMPDETSYGIQHLPNVSILGGGVVITDNGRIVGGIGVSGGPSGDIDHECANAGIDAIADELL
ncbi:MULTISPECIES: GlcG/HbpS family heme-binding protein [Thioalkalivibrio]|uniref:GlcG/HbpS family heme-binding protein n=1 Tax=Thioalkalivibrio TaxID=106633 RepID=UPI000366E319|nr:MULTISPECIES: heme-binding protein [Thioalkalivibrio]